MHAHGASRRVETRTDTKNFMYLIHLIPALALSLGGGHAGLHPANTNMYLEVPEIDAMISAYEEAPFAKFFRDEAVREFAARLIDQEPESITFTSLLDTIVDELRDQLPAAGVQVIDLIPEVDHLSFSISGIEIEGLADEIRQAEGEWSDLLQARAGQVRVQVVMDFSSEESAGQSVQLLREQLRGKDSPMRGMAIEQTKASFDGAELEWTLVHEANGGETPGLAFWFATTGPRLIFGAGFGARAGELFPAGQRLADSSEFKAAQQHFTSADGLPVMRAYLRADGLHEVPRLLALSPDFTLDVLGAFEHAIEFLVPGGSIESCSQTRLVGSRFITESFERDFAAADSPRLTSHEPVTRQSFEMVPAEAVGVWATHLNKEGLKTVLMDWLGKFTDEDPATLMATLEAKYGFRPDRDLIDPLGGGFAFYNLPFTGIGMPKMYVALELNDRDAFERGIEGLGKYLTEVGEGAVEFDSRPYRKNPFMSFSPGDNVNEMVDGADWTPAFLSLALAVGLMEDRAIFSLSSMYTKREMKRLLKSSDEDRHSLMESNEGIPSGITSYGTTDYAQILAGVYDSVRGFLPLISQGGGVELPFEIDDMPSSDLFAKYFEPTRSWTRSVDGGLYRYNESSFGPEVGLMFGVGVGVGALTFIEESQPMRAEIAPAPEEVWEERDPTTKTQDNLREVKVAIVVYKSEVGRYPASLADLLAPTETFPNGFLESPEVPKDGWDRGFRYRLDAEGADYQLWSRGADGIDQAGADDDIVLSK